MCMVFINALLKQCHSLFKNAARFCDRHDIMCFFSPLSFSLLLCLNWLCRWNEINNMSHNRSFFALELANREESVQFQTVSLCCPLGHISVSYWISQNRCGAYYRLVLTMHLCLCVGGAVTGVVWVCYVCVGRKVTCH